MISESDRELAALYTLNALTQDERLSFERLMASDPKLEKLVRELENDAACVALSVPQIDPPSGLRSRIVSAAASEVPLRIAERVPQSPERRPALQFLPWALAAGFAIFAGVLWSNLQTSSRDAAALAQQQALTADLYGKLAALDAETRSKDQLIAELRKSVSTLETRSSLAEMQVEALTSQLDASYLAAIAWDADSQEGVLRVERLPEAQPGKDYQLWVISPDSENPISAGVFTVEADGSATVRFAPVQPVTGATSFAVSVESEGGSPTPQGPIILTN